MDELQARAEAGDVVAQYELARRLDTDATGEVAAHWLQQAARQRHAGAVALLGAWLVVGHRLVANPVAGRELVRAAAAAGELASCNFAATLAVLGIGADRDLDDARDWLLRAAGHGSLRALDQLAALLPPERIALLEPLRASTAPSGAVDWPALRDALDLRSAVRRGSLRVRHDAPWIATADAVLGPSLCAYLTTLAASRLQRATVNDVITGETTHDMRSNSHAQFPLTDCDVVTSLIDLAIADLSGEPLQHQERSAVLSYQPGEQYAAHYDFIDPAVPGFATELATRGQRIATTLIYLNDDFTGGSTAFPELGLALRMPRGSALCFRSVDAAGQPDRRTLHAGEPPISGAKWLLSKWIRDRDQHWR